MQTPTPHHHWRCQRLLTLRINISAQIPYDEPTYDHHHSRRHANNRPRTSCQAVCSSWPTVGTVCTLNRHHASDTLRVPEPLLHQRSPKCLYSLLCRRHKHGLEGCHVWSPPRQDLTRERLVLPRAVLMLLPGRVIQVVLKKNHDRAGNDTWAAML